MIGYSFYFLFAVGIAILLTAAFRGLRRDDQRIAPLEEDVAFNRRIAEIEEDYGQGESQEEDRSDTR